MQEQGAGTEEQVEAEKFFLELTAVFSGEFLVGLACVSEPGAVKDAECWFGIVNVI